MKTIFAIALLCLLSLSLTAQGKLTLDQASVQPTVIAFFQAIADRDTSALRSLCTPDILIIEHDELWNMDTLLSKISQPTTSDFKRINSFDFIRIHKKGKVIWTTFHNHADVTRNGKQIHIHWLETAMLVKEKKLWKIHTLHSTLIKRGS